MPQAANSELLLYADDIRLVFQHSNTKTVEENLKRYFSTYVDWFVDNRLCAHFGEEKIHSFFSKT